MNNKIELATYSELENFWISNGEFEKNLKKEKEKEEYKKVLQAKILLKKYVKK